MNCEDEKLGDFGRDYWRIMGGHRLSISVLLIVEGLLLTFFPVMTGDDWVDFGTP